MKNKDILVVFYAILLFTGVFSFGFSVGVTTSYYFLVNELSEISINIELNETALVQEMNETMDYQINNVEKLMNKVIEMEEQEVCGLCEEQNTIKGYCDSPDTRFFERIYLAGGQSVMCMGSITFHKEAVARRSHRHYGTEHMINEDNIEGKT